MILRRGLYSIYNDQDNENGLYNDEKISPFNIKFPSSDMKEEEIQEYISKGNWKTYKIN